MADIFDMTLEKFTLWSSIALKVFLSCRKKSIEGSFQELSARSVKFQTKCCNIGNSSY